MWLQDLGKISLSYEDIPRVSSPSCGSYTHLMLLRLLSQPLVLTPNRCRVQRDGLCFKRRKGGGNVLRQSRVQARVALDSISWSFIQSYRWCEDRWYADFHRRFPSSSSSYNTMQVVNQPHHVIGEVAQSQDVNASSTAPSGRHLLVGRKRIHAIETPVSGFPWLKVNSILKLSG